MLLNPAPGETDGSLSSSLAWSTGLGLQRKPVPPPKKKISVTTTRESQKTTGRCWFTEPSYQGGLELTVQPRMTLNF